MAGLSANSAWGPLCRITLCSDGIAPIARLCVDSGTIRKTCTVV